MDNKVKIGIGIGAVVLIAVLGLLTSRFFGTKKQKPQLEEPAAEETTADSENELSPDEGFDASQEDATSEETSEIASLYEGEIENDLVNRTAEMLEIDPSFAETILLALHDLDAREIMRIELRDAAWPKQAMYRDQRGTTFILRLSENEILGIWYDEESDETKIWPEEGAEALAEEPKNAGDARLSIGNTQDRTLSDLKVQMSSVTEPISQGEWGIAGVWINQNTIEPVALRITNVIRGENAQNYVTEATKDDIYGFENRTLHDALEYVVLEMDVYVPQDAASPVSFIRMYLMGEDGDWLDTAAYDLDDMEVIHFEDDVTVLPGEQAHITAWYTMEKDRYIYLIKAGDSNLIDEDFLWIRIDETPETTPEEPAAEESASEESESVPEQPAATEAPPSEVTPTGEESSVEQTPASEETQPEQPAESAAEEPAESSATE